jgi:hypothetical protein
MNHRIQNIPTHPKKYVLDKNQSTVDLKKKKLKVILLSFIFIK